MTVRRRETDRRSAKRRVCLYFQTNETARSDTDGQLELTSRSYYTIVDSREDERAQ
jgi:hypothetical protein